MVVGPVWDRDLPGCQHFVPPSSPLPPWLFCMPTRLATGICDLLLQQRVMPEALKKVLLLCVKYQLRASVIAQTVCRVRLGTYHHMSYARLADTLCATPTWLVRLIPGCVATANYRWLSLERPVINYPTLFGRIVIFVAASLTIRNNQRVVSAPSSSPGKN